MFTNMAKQKTTAHLSLFISYLFFGINVTVSKELMSGVLSPVSLNGFRFTFGALAFWLCSAFFKEKVEKKDLLLLFIGAMLGLVFNQVMFIQGLSRTSPIDASIIGTSLPIITMLLAALMIREPITWLKTFGVLLGASGAVFLVYTAQHEHTGSSNLVGDLLCFGSSMSFALYLVVTRGLNQKYSSITMMKWMFLFASIVFLPFCLTEMVSINYSAFSQQNWTSLAFVLILATVIPYFMIPIGQKYLRPTTVAMYNYVIPVVATFLAIYVGQDHFSPMKGLAAILVFTGVFVVTRSKSRADMEQLKKNVP